MKKTYQSIVVLTGAGVSAESGIRTFRAADGLWEDHRVEDVATPEAFIRDPALVHRFYNARRQQLLNGQVKPNLAHKALADFAVNFNGSFTLVTQNIDNLHERAGSKDVIHMHGEILKKRCVNSGEIFPCMDDTAIENLCQCCNSAANLRPHIVWFGEMPLEMDIIYQALMQCDLFIAIGTSGNVYPAAGFVQVANQAGARTVELNLEPSAVNSQFTEHYHGQATDIVPKFLDAL